LAPSSCRTNPKYIAYEEFLRHVSLEGRKQRALEREAKRAKEKRIAEEVAAAAAALEAEARAASSRQAPMIIMESGSSGPKTTSSESRIQQMAARMRQQFEARNHIRTLDSGAAAKLIDSSLSARS
jgi:hypothetical protein